MEILTWKTPKLDFINRERVEEGEESDSMDNESS